VLTGLSPATHSQKWPHLASRFELPRGIAPRLSATRKLSCNRVLEVIEANRRGTWTINALIVHVDLSQKALLRLSWHD
jgi:hypothetical protein